MFNATTVFSRPFNIAPIVFGIFGVTLLLAGVDVLVKLSGVDVSHQSSLRIALTYPFEEKWDSWRPMLQALQTMAEPDRSHLYETLFFERSLKFQYPLFSLLYLMPLRDWPAADAISFLNKLNFVLEVIFAGVVAAIADVAARRSRFLDRHSQIFRSTIIVVSFLAAMTFYPVVKAVDLGQIQMWLDLAFALSVLSWMLGWRALAGALIGFASTIKPQFGLLLVWGLLWRDWSFVIGYLIVLVPIGALSLAIFGLHNNIAYLNVLSFISAHGEAYYPNNSVNGIMNRLLFNGSASTFSNAFAPPQAVVLWSTRLAFVAFILFGLKNALLHGRNERPTVVDLGLATLCAVMSSPVAWEHHYGIVMPLFVLAFFLAFSCGSVSTPIVIGLVLSWSLAANYINLIAYLGDTHFNLLQAHLFFACLWLVWFLGARRGEESAWLDGGKQQAA